MFESGPQYSPESQSDEPENWREAVIDSVDTLRSEHLDMESGYRPIVAILIDASEFEKMDQSNIETIVATGLNVDYYENDERLEKEGVIVNSENVLDGEHGYVLSPVDSRDKYTEGLYNCTGISVVGIDEKTGKPISFLTHQDPHFFLAKGRAEFKDEVSDILIDFKEKAIPGSIDATIFGGNFDDYEDEDGTQKDDDYIESIELMNSMVRQYLHFDAVVITGPNTFTSNTNADHEDLQDKEKYATAVYFDTEYRRLYLVRGKQVVSNANKPYQASDIDKQFASWYVSDEDLPQNNLDKAA